MRIRHLICLAALLAPTLASADAIGEIRDRAQNLARAFSDGNYQEIVRLMPPDLVDSMGGQVSALEVIKDGLLQIAEQGFSIESYDVLPPDAIHLANEYEVAYVPTRMVLDGPKTVVRSEGFLVAVRRAGADRWSFIDGAGFEDPNVLFEMFPGLPEAAAPPELKSEVTPKPAD